MRVLVTGGAGYIGSHTAKALARSGFEPVVFDNLSTGHRWAVKWGPLIEADLADKAAIRATLQAYQVEAVIHFAASAYVGESVQNPRKYFRNNVVNTLNLLDAMQDAGVKHIVFSSTCATYGVPESVPIPEDHPQRPVNPYGESKLFIERALRWYQEAYGFRWAALRYFNAAGADPDGELGEAHDPETHLIPLVIEVALGQRPYVEIYGTDYPTRDGTAVRDYVHVADLAEAHVLALHYLLDGAESTALNLGTGKPYSVREVIAAVEHVSRKEVAVREAPRRPGDPPVLVANVEKAKALLGWEPRYTEIECIIETAYRWHAKRLTQGQAGPGRGL
ncbi:UDP-glucose 4-epimerase GalE [Thermaerobacter litoralis]